ncbi:hypothetical protein AUEXF2481DRAFT_684151 [Aureobasidium subglaciale EXF-2481]|uniref:Ankyrin repeat protein n=1 Tax=Aureobasidium subglaciale (strain EXF-2481) TaxID=1043005 RepID=A0A074YNT0_AURSE|nr:uncharacterized protein AUEXF2481DRAFT_684151 [Aureobasidium subglaciale EXF-2481]KEQ95717.1 hypothetical protein AUEXF2481DRAFT_684151 [Aureobasidium subglaciale EXF-2481]
MPSKQKSMPYPWEMIVDANRTGSVGDIDLILLEAFELSTEAYDTCVASVREKATVGNKVDRLQYLIDEGHIDVDKKLVQLVYRDDDMVRWCLDDGAIVDDTDKTMLADVASFGSIDTLRLLHEHGASISESTLNNAAWRGRPEMVAFLIDHVGIDINKAYAGKHEPLLRNQTALCSAAISPLADGVGEVAKALLEPRADPYHEDSNALEEATNSVVIDVFHEWKHNLEEPKTKTRKTTHRTNFTASKTIP